MRKLFASILLLLSLSILAFGQIEKIKSDTSRYLLLNYALQYEITDAVDNLYNFDFHKAEVEFNWLKYNYPDHPLPYFLYGMSTWWQMMPNLDKESPLGEEFLAYMDTTITKAEAIYDEDESNIEAAFFMAGAYGFKGRYHSEKKNWGRAAGSGRLALKYLEKTHGNESFSPEILFGDALFNYYSIWIRENYPMLKPILIFFPKGDKEVGIKQLEEVSRNAFYTRMEAIYFLMRINAFELNKTFDALRQGEYIFNQYPNNPYFHRFYARMLYTTGQYSKAEEVSLEILKRIEAGQNGYEEVSGRYASFFLGHIYKRRDDWETAKPYFEKVLEFTESIESEESGYYLFAQYYIAEDESKNGLYDQALERVKVIRENSSRKQSVNRLAKKLKKEIRKKR